MRMKKGLTFLVAAAVVFSLFSVIAVPASAATSGTTGECTWTLDGTVLTISGNGAMGDYEYDYFIEFNPWGTSITEVIIESGVTSIGNSAFGGCNSLTNIIIPDSVTSIGDSAFYDCNSLTDIIIPDSVSSIGESAFSGCKSLTNIIIPDSVTSIGSRAFNGCTSLTHITIPDGVTSVEGDTFAYCTNLTDITIPDSVSSIGSYAFNGCTSLTHITIPDSVTSIGSKAFANCSELRHIVFEGNAPTFGSEALSGVYAALYPAGDETWTEDVMQSCGVYTWFAYDGTVGGTTGDCTWTLDGTVLTISGNGEMANYGHGSDDELPTWQSLSITEVIIEPGVKSIGDSAFWCCYGLTHITIPDSVTSIGDSAFEFSYLMTSITIPENVSSIGEYAFAGCSLTSITIPGSVTYIGEYALKMAPNLEEVIFEGDAPTPGGYVFEHEMATAYYPANNSTWTEDVMQDYGGYITWVPYEVVEEPKTVEEWNVSLEDDLRVNFHLNGNIADTATVTVSVGDSTDTCNISTLEKDESGRYIVSVNVAAAQMNDSITLQVTDMEPVEYTVRQYCDTVLGDESYSRYHTMIKEMLNYGGAAQTYFGYETQSLANEGISGAGAAEIPETAEAEMAVSGGAENVSFYAASLLYRDKIALRFYFNITGSITDYTFAVNDHTYTPVLKDGYYYIEVSGILPENLNQQVEMSVTDESGNVLTVSYSPMNYIVRMNEKGSDTLKSLLKALYNYHLAAKALRAV